MRHEPDEFITELEEESARRGMTQVQAARTVRICSEAERLAAPQSSKTDFVTQAPTDGCDVIYFNGPEGAELEFVRTTGGEKERFAEAAAAAMRKLTGARWSRTDRRGPHRTADRPISNALFATAG